MEDVASLEQLERQEQLLAVGAHGLDVQSHILPVLLQHLSQVHAADESAAELANTHLTPPAGRNPPPSLPERLKHQTQVLLVVEMPEEAKAVELVVGIGVIQLLEELQLFQTRLLPVRGRCFTGRWTQRARVHRRFGRTHSHELVVSDDLDCHLLASPGSVPGSDHVAEHALARVAINVVALVQRLPDVDP